jgi:hypothetical protein
MVSAGINISDRTAQVYLKTIQIKVKEIKIFKGVKYSRINFEIDFEIKFNKQFFRDLPSQFVIPF